MAIGQEPVWDTDPWLKAFVAFVGFGLVFGVSTLLWVLILGAAAGA